MKNTFPRFFKGDIGSGTLFVVAIMIGLIGFATVMTRGVTPPTAQPTGSAVTPVLPQGDPGKSNLQLYTFGYTTPAPTPTTAPPTPTSPPTGQSCGPNDDNGIPQPPGCKCDAYSDTIAINCKGDKAYADDGSLLGLQYDGYCGGDYAPSDGRYCIAKPVIYLYPQIPTIVNVQVESLGKIVVSDPNYPVGGWKNILANPNGDLYYQNKLYTELFYESEVKDFKKPEKGIIIRSQDLPEELGDILDQLGLINNEKAEFLDFWIPRLKALKSPYIFFSVLDKSEKDRLDKVSISPYPDTIIEFIAYFKPISDPSNYDGSLKLPSKQIRYGFVSVEWGGSLDTISK